MDAKDFQETIAKARDAITVKRVYGQPYERDGITVIPAAAVGGGAGGGGGEDAEGKGVGGGSGFGIAARPVGAYVIENGNVRWVPARDYTQIAQRALVTLSLVALVLLRFHRKA
jgi:uncharacterized spore protein YtfJ